MGFHRGLAGLTQPGGADVAGGATIYGASCTLDIVGIRTAKTDHLAGVTSNYAYDAIYELLQVTQGTGAAESYAGAYPERSRRDPVGNRLSSLGLAHTREAMHDFWHKNDPKDAQVILSEVRVSGSADLFTGLFYLLTKYARSTVFSLDLALRGRLPS